MNNQLLITLISTLLICFIVFLWIISMSILRTNRVTPFLPFFLLSFNLAYNASFVFFELYASSAWVFIELVNVFAFSLIVIRIMQKL